MIRPSSAFWEIWWPQLGPTTWALMSVTGTLRSSDNCLVNSEAGMFSLELTWMRILPSPVDCTCAVLSWVILLAASCAVATETVADLGTV